MSGTEQAAAATVVAEPETKTKTRKREKPAADKSKPKRQPPYAVVLLNDDVHTFNYVIELLQKVFGYNTNRALLLTTQVHFAGRAIVWTGTLEGAELKRDLIHGYGTDFYASPPVKFPLGVELEPLPVD